MVFADDNEDETDSEDANDETEDETEIEVEVKNDKAKVKIKLNGDKYRFVVNDVSESVIIAAIIDETGLTEDEIRSTWDFETEDDSKSPDKESQIEEKLMKHENKSQEKDDDTILQLQQKIDQLEQRLQNLLDKFETGEYFGKVTEPDPVPDSFVITLDGFASSLDDDTVVSMDGVDFLRIYYDCN